MHKLASRLLIAGALFALAGSVMPSPQAFAVSPNQGNGPARDTATTPRSYVPLVFNNWPLITVFGIETVNYTAAQGALAGSNATWIRRNALQWKDVESNPGQRNWDAGLDADLINASKNHQQVVLIIHGTPLWARTIPSSTCSPIKPDQLGAFASFVGDAVSRYSKPPYNVKYWEIWNEPDAPANPNINQPYGCWGNPNDPYFGGGDYANVLKIVSPQIRQTDPGAKIVLGGLLLGCKPGSCASNEDRYLEGIINNGGGPHFDIVNFHGYDFYDVASNVIGRYSGGSQWGTTSANDGPVLVAKARFLRATLSRLGVTGKQLMNTEVGLLCWECAFAPANFVTSKVYYIAQAYSAAIAEGLIANVWYSYEGWFQSDLTGPAYDAYKVALSKLEGVKFIADIGAGDVGSAGIRGYKFTRAGKSVWVIWSPSGAAQPAALFSMPASITDAMGVSQLLTQNFSVTANPLYIEFP